MNAENEYYLHDDKENFNSEAMELERLLADVKRPVISDIEAKAIEESQITGEPIAAVAHKYKLNLGDKQWWSAPDDLNEDVFNGKTDLIGKYKNPLVDMAKAVAASVQFPLNTTFLHIIGAVSSTTIRRFTYKSRYGSPKHCGLYTLGAQPPSTGKSPTNKYIVDPIKHYIEADNERNEPMRMITEEEILKLEREFKKSKTAGQQKDIAQRIIDKRKNLLLLSEYTWGATDTTAEAIEECAAKQHGRFSIVSDEAEAISVVFGVNYSKGQANFGIVLKGFDGGDQLSLRIGRQGFKGTVIGSVAVLAQESTVTNILQAGRNESGSRGICERFLIISEPNIIHEKNHRHFKPVPEAVEKTYIDMIAAVVNTQFDTTVHFSDEAMELLITILEGLQVHIVDGGKYANELMRGVIGKAETQICKIAATLHIAKEWAPPFRKSLSVGYNEMAAASSIYVQLIRNFVNVAEDEGLAGKTLEMRVASKKLKSIINDTKKPRQIVKICEFSDSLRNTAPFSTVKGLRKYMKGLLPDLQKAGFIVADEKEGVIFINPRLKE